MKSLILIGKVMVLLFWGAVLASLFAVFPKGIETALYWAGAIVLFCHFLEVILFTGRFGDRLVEAKLNKFMVLVFGLFYVLPFMRTSR